MIYFNCKYQYQYLHKDDFEKQPVASVNNTHYENNTQGLTRECTPLIKGFGCCGWFPPPLRQVLAHSEMRCLEPRKLGRKSPYQTEWANEQDMTTCTNPDQNWVIRWGWALSPVNHKRTGTLDLDCRYSNIKVQDECHVLELYFVNHVVGHNGILYVAQSRLQDCIFICYVLFDKSFSCPQNNNTSKTNSIRFLDLYIWVMQHAFILILAHTNAPNHLYDILYMVSPVVKISYTCTDIIQQMNIGPCVWTRCCAIRLKKRSPEQWKEPWLFQVYRGLYYPVMWGL